MSSHFVIATVVGLGIIAPTATLAQGPPCERPSAEACGSYYSDLARALPGQIESAEQRRALLPSEIAAANERAVTLRGEYNALAVQAPHHARLVSQLEATRDMLYRLEASATSSRENLADLPAMAARRIPALVARLRDYLAGREERLAEWVAEIDSELHDSITAEARRTLRFERARLLEIQVLQRRHGSADAARRAIHDALTGPAVIHDLSPETQALLREARATVDGSLEVENALERVAERLAEVSSEIESAQRENNAQLRTEQDAAMELAARIEAKERELTAARAEHARLQAEAVNILGRLRRLRHRQFMSGMYWNCCDNRPFCHAWRRGADISFEGTVDALYPAGTRNCSSGGEF